MDINNIKIVRAQDTIVENFFGVQLTIARGMNANFKKKFATLSKPYNHAIQTGSISEEKSAEITAKALVGTVLLGWSEFYIDGEEVNFTDENAVALLQNDDDCRAFIIEQSSDLSNFLKKSDDAIEKKS